MTLFRFFVLAAFASVPLLAQEPPATPTHQPDPYGILKRLESEKPLTNWEVYLQSSERADLPKSDYVVMTFNPGRVERLGEGRYRLWTRSDFAEKRTYSVVSISYSYDSSIALEEISCPRLQRHTIRTLLYLYTDQDSARQVYDWKSTADEDQRWKDTIPGTVGEVGLKYLCQHLKDLPQPKPTK